MAMTKTHIQTKFREHVVAAKAATPKKGTCTVSAGGIKVVRKHVTEKLCKDVAHACGGTCTFVPD
jgi:hypothetical protein